MSVRYSLSSSALRVRPSLVECVIPSANRSEPKVPKRHQLKSKRSEVEVKALTEVMLRSNPVGFGGPG